ncbi:MAG: 23S rRNA (uracil(1939)-C(5))-methyltransferase RlmD [Lachnospiraceae bacterium]|nr:23S rRNA (uracil(1939)-C(5))-methyltransferase RlmD [Lachnospiraceae bacterium]
MKKNELVTGIVERLDFPNKGLVKVDDTTFCTAKNVLPGQKVVLRIKKIRKGKGEGNLIEVVEKAPYEIEPSCEHFGICGGCSYLSLSYEEQLKLKESQVKRLLEPFLEDEVWEGIKKSPVNEEYRNKMEFTFGDEVKDGPLSLGMHKKGSFYDIVTVDKCRIVDEDYRSIIRATLDFFREKKIPYYHRMRHEGYLRHLLVRKAKYTGQILVAIVTSSQMDIDMSEYKDMLLGLKVKGEFKGILHIINDSLADTVQADRTDILYGRDHIEDKILGLDFKISTFSFFQTNTLSAEVLYSTVRDYIGDLGKAAPVVYDLYSGTGTIAQLMAPVAGKVIGVEIVEEAVEAAKENALLNSLHNCDFIAGDVLKVLDTIGEKPDFIILDPPRDGIHPKALGKIISYGIDRMIYISCKPTSLARDMEAFAAAGYHITRACCIDQFPGTGHVETVVLLSRV